MHITLTIFLQIVLYNRVYSVSCINIAFKVVFILHRNNVSLQANIFFQPYLDICAMYRRYMNPKAALFSALDFVNSHEILICTLNMHTDFMQIYLKHVLCCSVTKLSWESMFSIALHKVCTK